MRKGVLRAGLLFGENRGVGDVLSHPSNIKQVRRAGGHPVWASYYPRSQNRNRGHPHCSIPP